MSTPIPVEFAPELLEQAVDYKPSLVLAGLRYLQSNSPEVYAVLAQEITSRPQNTPAVGLRQT